LAGEYDDVVGQDKPTFLQDCSNHLSPLICVDVRAGSIIIELRGEENQVTQAEAQIEQDGLHIPDYPSLYTESGGSSDASMIFIGIAAILILCACAGAWRCWCLKSSSQNVRPNDRRNGPDVDRVNIQIGELDHPASAPPANVVTAPIALPA